MSCGQNYNNFLLISLLHFYNISEWFETPAELNTKVYVSNLPLDITQDEFIEVMSKCGMIVRDSKTNKMKVKLYAEAGGQLKGDGLCHYIRVSGVFMYIFVGNLKFVLWLLGMGMGI